MPGDGGGDAITASEAEVSVRANCCWEVPPQGELSWTPTQKVNVPAAVGVPEIAPPLDRVRPSGSGPATKYHLYGAVPPVAVRTCEYGTPTVPWGNGEVVEIDGMKKRHPP
jgi:hypothetical protein